MLIKITKKQQIHCNSSRVILSCRFQATAEANNLTAVAEAKELYTKLMEEVCGGAKPYLQTQLLEAEHSRIKDKALHSFHSKRKMGGDEFSQSYFNQLIQVLTCFMSHLQIFL